MSTDCAVDKAVLDVLTVPLSQWEALFQQLNSAADGRDRSGPWAVRLEIVARRAAALSEYLVNRLRGAAPDAANGAAARMARRVLRSLSYIPGSGT
jgi:hypothetical protein